MFDLIPTGTDLLSNVRDFPHHVGFDAVLAVRASVLQDLLATYYQAGSLPSRFTVNNRVAPALAGSIRYSYDLVLHQPRLRVQRAAGRKFLVDVRLAGTLETAAVDQDGRAGPATKYEATLATTLVVPVVLEELPVTGITLNLAFDEVTLRDFALTLIKVQTGNRDNFAELLIGSMAEEEIRTRLVANPGRLPLMPGMLNTFTAQPLTTENVTLLIDDDLVILAVDGIGVDENGAPTKGDDSLLHDFTFGSPLALIIHPRFLDQAIQSALDATRADLQQAKEEFRNDITVDWVRYRIRKGSIKIWGHATKHNIKVTKRIPLEEGGERVYFEDNPDIPATFEIKLHAVVHNYSQDGTLDIEAYEVNIDVPDWFKTLGVMLSVFSVGLLGPFSAPLIQYVYNMAHSLLGRAEYQLDRNLEDGLPKIGTYDLPLPALPDQFARISIVDARMGYYGLETRARIRPPRPQLSIFPILAPGELYVTEAARIRVGYRLSGAPLNENDPELRITWYVLRDGAEVPGAARTYRYNDPEGREFEFQVTPGAYRYTALLMLYHMQDGVIKHLAEARHTFHVHDRLDRRYPFVSWSYYIWEPIMQNSQVGERTVRVLRRTRFALRQSRIHRTDVPGRCRFADQISERKSMQLRYLKGMNTQREVLLQRRDELCDYCFFGGPDKTEPREDLPDY